MPATDPTMRRDLDNDELRKISTSFTLCRQIIDLHDDLELETKGRFRELSMKAQGILERHVAQSEYDVDQPWDASAHHRIAIWQHRIESKFLELLRTDQQARKSGQSENVVHRDTTVYIVYELLGLLEIGIEKFG